MHLWDVTTILEASHQLLHEANVYEYVVYATSRLRSLTGLPVYYEGFTYLPHTLLMYAPFYALYYSLTGVEWPIVDGHFNPTLIYPEVYLFLLIIKLPVIMADTLITYLLAKRRPSAGLLYALSPYSIMITSVWGNFDSVIGFLMLSTYLMFKRSKLFSGFLYGLSLMKPYGLVVLPFFLMKLSRHREALAKFFLGLSIALTPTLYFLLLDPRSVVAALLYHVHRAPKGLNVYNASLFLEGLRASKEVGKAASALLLGTLILVFVQAWRRRVPLLEGLIVGFVTYLIFSPVTNEQYLAAVLPIALLSEKASTLLFLASHVPLFYALFNTGPLYFATPIMWAKPELLGLWMRMSVDWSLITSPHSLQILYLMSLCFTSVLILVERRCLELQVEEGLECQSGSR